MTAAIGTKTPYTLGPTSDQSSYSWSHTRAAGAGLQVCGLIRSNGNPSPTVTSVTFGSTTMTVQAQDKQDGVDKIISFVATLDPGVGPEGSQTVTVTMSESDSRDFAGYAVDIIDTGGAAGGAATSVSDAGGTSVSTSYTPTVSNELLLALGGCRDAAGNPAPGSGWTDEGTVQSRSWSVGVEVRLESRVAADTSAQTADVTLATSLTDRGIVVAGWKPQIAILDASLVAQAAAASGEIVTHLLDAALQADPATASADLDLLIALQAAIAAQAGSASGAIDHAEALTAALAVDPASVNVSLGSALGLQGALAAGRAEAAVDILASDIPVWPSTLPDPQRRSFSGRRQRGSWRFEPEVGAPVEVLGSWRLHEINCEFLLDDAQLTTWQQFFDTDIRSGALAFRGREPWARAGWLYLLAAPPDLTRRAHGVHVLRLRLVGMPA